MTYEEALAYWYGRINYEQRSPRRSDLKLDRMRALLKVLGEPHRQLSIVHIAGSKGKGSTAAMLAAVLSRAGYRTGLFTSPHLSNIEERIQIDGVPLSRDDVASLMDRIAVAEQKLDADVLQGRPGVTFFEVVTALGFLAFIKHEVDIAVVEVGLGGRFDATNVCDPLLSIITSISFDHTRQLGNRLASIAFEKAGIIKPHRPVVSGVREPEAAEVIRNVCQQRSSPLQELGTDFHYRYQPGRVAKLEYALPRMNVRTAALDWPEYSLRLLGEHQAANAALVIAAAEELGRQGYRIPHEAVAEGLQKVEWPARLEVIERSPLIVLDCAHNVASAQALLETLRTSFSMNGQRIKQQANPRRALIFAGTQEKDLRSMLRELAPQFDHVFLTQYRNNPRVVPAQTLAKILTDVSTVPYTIAETSEDAWEQARAHANADDLICITGSVFLAGELRPLLVQRHPSPRG